MRHEGGAGMAMVPVAMDPAMLVVIGMVLVLALALALIVKGIWYLARD